MGMMTASSRVISKMIKMDMMGARGHGGEEATHADDGEIADEDMAVRQRAAQQFAIKRAADRAHEERGGEDAADRAAAGGSHGGDDLEEEDGEEYIPGPRVLKDVVDDAVAVAPRRRDG